MRSFPILAGFAAAMVVAACSAGPDAAYRLSDAKAKYRDTYYATKQACQAEGGHLVVKGDLRHREGAPDFPTWFWCSRRLD